MGRGQSIKSSETVKTSGALVGEVGAEIPPARKQTSDPSALAMIILSPNGGDVKS